MSATRAIDPSHNLNLNFTQPAHATNCSLSCRPCCCLKPDRYSDPDCPVTPSMTVDLCNRAPACASQDPATIIGIWGSGGGSLGQSTGCFRCFQSVWPAQSHRSCAQGTATFRSSSHRQPGQGSVFVDNVQLSGTLSHPFSPACTTEMAPDGSRSGHQTWHQSIIH